MRQASQTSAAKKTTAKTNTSKIRFEIPVPQKAFSNEDYYKKVQEKAYEIYLQRNGAPGSAEEDWRQAEKIVKGA